MIELWLELAALLVSTKLGTRSSLIFRTPAPSQMQEGGGLQAMRSLRDLKELEPTGEV